MQGPLGHAQGAREPRSGNGAPEAAVTGIESGTSVPNSGGNTDTLFAPSHWLGAFLFSPKRQSANQIHHR